MTAKKEKTLIKCNGAYSKHVNFLAVVNEYMEEEKELSVLYKDSQLKRLKLERD